MEGVGGDHPPVRTGWFQFNSNSPNSSPSFAFCFQLINQFDLDYPELSGYDYLKWCHQPDIPAGAGAHLARPGGGAPISSNSQESLKNPRKKNKQTKPTPKLCKPWKSAKKESQDNKKRIWQKVIIIKSADGAEPVKSPRAI